MLDIHKKFKRHLPKIAEAVVLEDRVRVEDAELKGLILFYAYWTLLLPLSSRALWSLVG